MAFIRLGHLQYFKMPTSNSTGASYLPRNTGIHLGPFEHLKTTLFVALAYVHYPMKILIRTNNIGTSRCPLLATSAMMEFDRTFLIPAPVPVSSTLHERLRNATF
jgi:hypothetical protein